MRLAQIVDDNDKRALVVTARGESRLVKGLRTTRDLAAEALAEGAPLRKIIADRGIGKPVDLAAALKEKRVLLAARPRRPGACLRHRHRPHPSRLGRGARQDAPHARRRDDADRTR